MNACPTAMDSINCLGCRSVTAMLSGQVLIYKFMNFRIWNVAMFYLSRIVVLRLKVVFPLLGLAILTACGGSSNSTTPPPQGQFTHVYVVFPPQSGTNNQHFMSTVMNQAAIEGVTVSTDWNEVETGTPGLATCTPAGTDTCQMDAAGFTHTYNWSTVDTNNSQWFTAQSGSKKVNVILDGIGSAAPVNLCLQTNSCINPITPYYVTSASWAAQLATGLQDVINGEKDGCTNDVGLQATAMSRDASGLVTVTVPGNSYQNGDLVWIGGTTPSTYNIAQEKVTNVQVSSGILTITAANSFPVGMQVTFENLGNATFLNGQTVTVQSSTATQFTATTSFPDYSSTPETVGTANPLGVAVQNANAGTFQYQTGIQSADSGPSVLGTVVSAQQSYPIPYETAYKTAWEAFVAAAIYHFNHSANLSQISYMRVGRSVGGEAYPYCIPNLEQLPAPNTFTKTVWVNYYADIDQFVASQNPTMQILDPLNQAGTGLPGDPIDTSYADSEGQTAITFKNASGQTNGIGSQGLQASDITNYAAGNDCTSDWCNLFNDDYQLGIPLELQQLSLSAPIQISGTNDSTGDLRQLLPFAVTRHMTILELYNLDALLAYDPNYCVLTGTAGECGSGSVEIPTITLPAGDQYQYFQAVGQPGQTGATGNGSYANVINQTEGQH